MMPPEEHKPPKKTILPYYLAGAVIFVLVNLLCLLSAEAFSGHYFQPALLAITHLAILGWATVVIFGASNQLAPVISEAPLNSNTIPVWVLPLKLIGVLLLVLSFWRFEFGWASYTGGGFIIAAIILHAWNIYRTASRGAEHIIKDFFVVAHVWLLFTAIIGLSLLVNLRFPIFREDHLHYLRIHGGLGLAGWFLQLVIGISSRLIPMFLLSRNEDTRELRYTYLLFNAGLILLFAEGMIFGSRLGAPLYLGAIALGLVFYIRFVSQCYRTAMRKQLDFGMKQTFLAIILLVLPLVFLVLSWLAGRESAPQMLLAFGVAFLFGFISTIIMGQTFKTLPFIVWMHLARHDQIPELMPKDLFKEGLVRWQMLLYLLGFLVFMGGILYNFIPVLYFGAAFMSIAAILYLCHVVYVIAKLRKHVS